MKKFYTSIGFVAALLLTFSVASSQKVPDHWLDHDIFGNKRILLVCNTGIDNPSKRVLPAMDWEGFAERDVVVVAMSRGGVKILNADGTRDFPSSDSLSQVHQRKKCDSGIDFNLIGKDGGVKKRWSDTVWTEDLFTTIDAMPMRRYEMRLKKSQN